MIKRKVYSYFLKAGLIILGFLFCLTIGFFMGSKKGTTTITNISSQEKYDIDTIAIVNLDTGVEVGGERVFYGANLIAIAKDNFIQTNMKDAQDGISTGKYAAYIIIPSNFSECVVSLNSTPQEAHIEYALNLNLNETSLISAVSNVEEFYQKITDEISYMYTSSILSSVHTMQDSSVIIMNNDARDTAALQSIRATDLTTLINVPELITVNNNITPIDFSSYLNRNSECVAEIQQKYAEWNEQGKVAFLAISNESNAIKSVLNSSINVLEDFNINIDENNEVYFDISACGTVSKEISEYNDLLDDKEAEIASLFEAQEREINSKINDWNNVINNYNSTMISNDINESAQAIYDSWGEISAPTFSSDGVNVIVANDTGMNSQTITLEYVGQEQALARMKAVEEYARELETLIETGTDLNTIKAEYQTLQNNINLINTGCNSMDELLNTINASSDVGVKLDVNKCAEQLQVAVQEVSGDANLSVNEIADKIKITPFSDIVNGIAIREDMKVIAQEINSELSQYYNADDSEEQSVILLPRIEHEELVEAINIDVVDPIYSKDSNYKLISDLRQNEKVAEASIDSYIEKLQSFNPYDYVDENELNNYLNLIESNTAVLNRMVVTHYSEYMQYVRQVEMNSSQNLSNILNAVNNANQVSQEQIESGLSYAQSLKLETQGSNKELLTEFTTLLPYTRLGNLEYTNAYRFITTPTELVSLNGDMQIINSPIVTIEKIPSNNIPVYVIWIMLGVMAVTLVIYAIISLRNRNKSKKERDILL